MKKMFVLFVALMAFVSTAQADVEINRKELIQKALEAQSKSYAPYSKFNVAAAVLCDSGKIYTGANVENASFPVGVCAEMNAINRAVCEGERHIVAIAIVGGAGGVNSDFSPPCGVCRQSMREFSDPKDLLIILAKSPDDYIEKKLEELLPLSFGPDNL